MDTVEKTKREPLPTADALLRASIKSNENWWHGIRNSEDGYKRGAEDALQAVQAKITSGELVVVKMAALVYKEDHPSDWWCSECDWRSTPSHYAFCPGCGAKIVKA